MSARMTGENGEAKIAARDREKSGKILHTIGYAGFSLESFIATLKSNAINAIVDVRAQPHISHFDFYKRANLKPVLRENGIAYRFFGEALGARPENPELLSNGKTDFVKIRQSQKFQEICHNIASGLHKGWNICLMCAQIDPIICHRAILITDAFRYLHPEFGIIHILPDRLESQQSLDKRVLALYHKKSYSNSLLEPAATGSQTELQKAYAFQGNEIAWSTEK